MHLYVMWSAEVERDGTVCGRVYTDTLVQSLYIYINIYIHISIYKTLMHLYMWSEEKVERDGTVCDCVYTDTLMHL